MDEFSQGLFGITVCVLVNKIQTVVPQEGGVVVHLLHGYLDGRAQPPGAEGEGHVPGSLEGNEQPVRLGPVAAVADDGSSGQDERQVEQQDAAHRGTVQRS